MWNASVSQVLALANGFGVNTTADYLTPEAEPFRVYPATPNVVWAGDEGPSFETVFLVFPNEATAKAALPNLWSAA